MSQIEEKVIVGSPILETDSHSKFLCTFNSQDVLGEMRIPDSTSISGLTNEVYSFNKVEESANR